MAASIFFKPTKWFSSKNFKLIVNFPRLHSSSKSLHSPNLSLPQIQEPKRSTKEEELQRVFHHLDSNKDGMISMEELGVYFTSVGEPTSHDNVQRVIKDFDANGDDLLEFTDFVRLVEGGGDEDGVDGDLKRAFEMFEADKGDGVITPTGLQQMFNRLGDAKSYEECVAMIRVFDLDGNGVIDFHEFHTMMS